MDLPQYQNRFRGFCGFYNGEDYGQRRIERLRRQVEGAVYGTALVQISGMSS